MTMIAIISARRPSAVERMAPLLQGFSNFCWYVADAKDLADYRAAGAGSITVSGALCRSRNAALEDAAELGEDCVQISDDCTGVAWTAGSTRAHVQPITMRQAVAHMGRALAETGYWLAGAMPTANPFYAAPLKVQTRHFIVGDLIMVKHGSTVRFDERLSLKEDYDFTCAHIRRYGGVARVGSLLASFDHRTNAGGAVSYRTAEREQEAISLLKEKWPGWIKDNPKRPNEVLLKVTK